MLVGINSPSSSVDAMFLVVYAYVLGLAEWLAYGSSDLGELKAHWELSVFLLSLINPAFEGKLRRRTREQHKLQIVSVT